MCEDKPHDGSPSFLWAKKIIINDIDKEIALFKKSLGEDVLKGKRSSFYVEKAIKETIVPFFNTYIEKLNNFEELFIEMKRELKLKEGSKVFIFDLGKTGIIVSDVDSIFSDLEYQENPFVDSDGLVDNSPRFHLTSFKVDISFNGYKKNKFPQNISLDYVIQFQELEYLLIRLNPQSTLFREVYGQNKSKEELTTAVANEVKYFMEQLKQYV